MPFKKYSIQLKEYNLIKYKGVQPSFELVTKTIDKSKLTKYRFEVVYGIAEKTIERYLHGFRNMPPAYWHVFYEFDNLEKFYLTLRSSKKIKRGKKMIESPPDVIAETNKNLINAIRNRINK